MTDRAILLMAYGSPNTADEVEAYYTHIRGGRPPCPEAVERLKQRYALVGGRTPLLEISEAVRAGVERELARNGGERVYLGMKHWHPYIAETMDRMRQDGMKSFRAIALAPHYSRISIGGYRKSIEAANVAPDSALAFEMVESWHRHPLFIELIAKLVREAVAQFPADNQGEVLTIFSAHSLPERIREYGDPYERELAESAAAVARAANLEDWEIAWQSAGETGESWIGPDILEALDNVANRGVRAVLQVPIGFVSDHLEIFFDIDFEAVQRAGELGLEFRRTALPNSSPDFIQALTAIARDPISEFAAPSDAAS